MQRRVTVFLVAAMAAGAASAAGFGFLAETPMARFNGDDMRMMNEAVERALAASELGARIAWANDATRSSGEVTPLRAFERQEPPSVAGEQRRLHHVPRRRRLDVRQLAAAGRGRRPAAARPARQDTPAIGVPRSPVR